VRSPSCIFLRASPVVILSRHSGSLPVLFGFLLAACEAGTAELGPPSFAPCEVDDPAGYDWPAGELPRLQPELAHLVGNMNTRGLLTGAAWDVLASRRYAILWEHGEVKDISGELGIYRQTSSASAVNEAGTVLVNGRRSLPGDNSEGYVFLYRNGCTIPLGLGEGEFLNERSEVVGYRLGEAGYHVILWDETGEHDLGTFGMETAMPQGLNDQGQILVVASNWSQTEHIVYLRDPDGTTRVILDPDGQPADSLFPRLNNRGAVVAHGRSEAPFLATPESSVWITREPVGIIFDLSDAQVTTLGMDWALSVWRPLSVPALVTTFPPFCFWAHFQDDGSLVGSVQYECADPAVGKQAAIWRDGTMTVLDQRFSEASATDGLGHVVGNVGLEEHGWAAWVWRLD
jgi:hypothetical protein